jgi:mannose-6-phosphate isomerase-like protein (cupin superfamily)
VTPDGKVDASAGDLMTVPPRAVHTFENPSETEDCEVFMTATPGKGSEDHVVVTVADLPVPL